MLLIQVNSSQADWTSVEALLLFTVRFNVTTLSQPKMVVEV